ncbi:MAG TPA: Hpt domain-containing protein, partial [Chitinispirillaceae bacterium]|nr:Hpt domain-containing protein [Chitinispirillaceae bacterium]
QGKFEELSRYVHSVRGPSGMIGAMILTSALGEVEHACSTADSNLITKAIADMMIKFESTYNDIDKLDQILSNT